MTHYLEGLRWLTWGDDPGIFVPFNRHTRRSFARLVWGRPWIRPVNPLGNPWSGPRRWFTVRLPWFIFPFVSLRLGQFMFYLGAKTYRIGSDDFAGHTYARPNEMGHAVATFSMRWGREPLS